MAPEYLHEPSRRSPRAARLAASLLAACCALLPLQAQSPVSGPRQAPYLPDRPIVVRGGQLIDATGAPPRQDQAIVIQGDRIVSVGPMAQVTVPANAEIIEAAGMTIMPGLINSNQHIQINPLFPSPMGNLPLELVKRRWEKTWAAQPTRAFVYLMQGVTSMRNTSGPASQVLPVKRRIDAGELPGPRLFLGGALFMSEAGFKHYVARQHVPPDAQSFMRNQFAFHVVRDVDADTKAYEGPEFSYWKLLMSDEAFDGKNDFTDDELRAFIAKAKRLGKKVDVHCGGNNTGLRRMLAFDVDTLEHPFYGSELIDADVIEGYVRKQVTVASLLSVMINGAERAADPHRFDETLYAMSLSPEEHRILMSYRDRLLANRRTPDRPGLPLYDPAAPPDFPSARLGRPPSEGLTSSGYGPSYDQLQQRLRTSKENMRRFIQAGATLWMGTDTGAFMDFQQEDPNAQEMMHMVELGMPPMAAIEAATRNGARGLGRLSDLGTIEPGKLADVIVVAGNPLQDMAAMKRVTYVIKGGVRYK